MSAYGKNTSAGTGDCLLPRCRKPAANANPRQWQPMADNAVVWTPIKDSENQRGQRTFCLPVDGADPTIASMPRSSRASLGGYCYHVLNRGNGRRTVFRKDGDYAAFLKLLRQAGARTPVRLLAY